MTDSALVKTVRVAASPHEVWLAWTSVEGTRTFFAPDANIELRLGGKYEIYFDTSQPYGLKGSEGCKVLSFLPDRMLSFSWGAPSMFPKSRQENAQWVVVFFEPSGEGTQVTLTELGWKNDEESRAVYAYFDRAWGAVLGSLVSRFSDGPVDWKKLQTSPGSG
jgi:uncharacterized protein YndB with AHSA1/START domain